MVVGIIPFLVIRCDSDSQTEELVGKDQIQIVLDQYIQNNNDDCIEHFYNALNYAYNEQLDSSSQELSYFQKCSEENNLKGSYSDAIKALNSSIIYKDFRGVKFTVEAFIPILDSLKYDSITLFKPSEPYTIEVSD